MKRIAAIVLSLLMLLSVTAFAEQETIDLFTTENGSKVTLTMQEPYDIAFKDSSDDYMVATISRGELADVIVTITPTDSDVDYSLADLSDEDKQALIDDIYLDYAEFDDVTITEEVTKDGNAYLKVVAKSNGIEYHERFTIFEGYFFDRMQFCMNGELTDADEAFISEVQSGMWVTKAE